MVLAHFYRQNRPGILRGTKCIAKRAASFKNLLCRKGTNFESLPDLYRMEKTKQVKTKLAQRRKTFHNLAIQNETDFS
jgi:hypothetical protein